MRVLVIGATGTIGSAVVRALRDDHEVVRVGHTSGDHRVDLADPDSIEALFDAVGEVDHVVSAAGEARFRPLDELTDQDFTFCLENKLMGQVNVVRRAVERLPDGGSVTVTTGVLAEEPMPGGAAISLVNAGLQGFVRAAALEAPRAIRVNAVSPGWVAETLEEMGQDPSGGTPAAEVAKAYVRSVSGDESGVVIPASG